MGEVIAILDYRAAVQAKEIFNGPDKAKAFEQLKQHPRLLEVLAKMRRAQDGRPLAGPRLSEEGAAIAKQYRDVEEEGEGDAS